MCPSLSVLLGCSCCSTVDETLENVARGMASRMKKEKSHWAAGRVGDIDFVGTTKTRAKVILGNRYWSLFVNTQRDPGWMLIPTCLFMSSFWGCAATQTQCWSTRCWQRSGAWLLHTWWWPWWEETSWHRWSPGSGTLWEKDSWRLHRAQVIIKRQHAAQALRNQQSDDIEGVLCCPPLAGSRTAGDTSPRREPVFYLDGWSPK